MYRHWPIEIQTFTAVFIIIIALIRFQLLAVVFGVYFPQQFVE
jgi:hypothetical protein